jgi:hypothetical protein
MMSPWALRPSFVFASEEMARYQELVRTNAMLSVERLTSRQDRSPGEASTMRTASLWTIFAWSLAAATE